MNDAGKIVINDSWILSKRGKKNKVDPFKPYGWLIEKELTANGQIEDTVIVFLSNRECPFHCLMCDLWKNTCDDTVPEGAITAQIKSVLDQIHDVEHIKLYNSGSFFDHNAIPSNEYIQIAELLKDFKTVIVESHPVFINKQILEFNSMLKPKLEIAIGLETTNTEILKMLNKRMNLEAFVQAVRFLKQNQISIRAFILLKTPFMTEQDGIHWAQRSLDFAFDAGVGCCTVVPVRAGNGCMDILRHTGQFSLPRISSLEKVLEYGIRLGKGRVFADTWDLELFSDCSECFEKRTTRIRAMNLTQQNAESVFCACNL
ncbi:MAG TPA: hypothetical protein VHI78_07795 [Bacteroidales bacterium]|jgi:hypothetical protein|nr:hypothetical protein [Bacteroidales bacterium]